MNESFYMGFRLSRTKKDDNNETIQVIQVSEGYIRWLMMNHLGRIYEEESFRNMLMNELNDYFNIDCYDVLMGYVNDKDIYSKMKDDEITFSHGLVSILIKCNQVKILVQSKGILLETMKGSYILLLSVDNVFIKNSIWFFKKGPFLIPLLRSLWIFFRTRFSLGIIWVAFYQLILSLNFLLPHWSPKESFHRVNLITNLYIKNFITVMYKNIYILFCMRILFHTIWNRWLLSTIPPFIPLCSFVSRIIFF